MRKLLGLVLAAGIGVAASALILQGDTGTHDPTIVKVGSVYLRVSTGRGIPVSTSPDLVRWTSVGQIFPVVADYWAPDLVYRQGQWRLYYSASSFGSNDSRIALATNDHLDPEHPGDGWVDRGTVIRSVSGNNFNAIDPQVSQDSQGQDWIAYGSFWSGIKLQKLDPNGLLPASPGKVWSIGDRQAPPNAIEGAFIYRHADYFYLFVSFDFCCRGKNSTYKIAVGRSPTITGPYLDAAGASLVEGGGTIIRQSGERDIGPGHSSVFADGDQEYLVYHTYDARYGGMSKLRIDPLVWDQGWPK